MLRRDDRTRLKCPPLRRPRLARRPDPHHAQTVLLVRASGVPRTGETPKGPPIGRGPPLPTRTRSAPGGGAGLRPTLASSQAGSRGCLHLMLMWIAVARICSLRSRMLMGEVPQTVDSLTGSGGRHLLFAYPEKGNVPSKSDALGPGIDVRGEGGLIIVPPSLHASGRRYEWEDSSRPFEVELAEPPLWVLELVQRRATPSRPCANEIGEGAPERHAGPHRRRPAATSDPRPPR